MIYSGGTAETLVDLSEGKRRIYWWWGQVKDAERFRVAKEREGRWAKFRNAGRRVWGEDGYYNTVSIVNART